MAAIRNALVQLRLPEPRRPAVLASLHAAGFLAADALPCPPDVVELPAAAVEYYLASLPRGVPAPPELQTPGMTTLADVAGHYYRRACNIVTRALVQHMVAQRRRNLALRWRRLAREAGDTVVHILVLPVHALDRWFLDQLLRSTMNKEMHWVLDARDAAAVENALQRVQLLAGYAAGTLVLWQPVFYWDDVAAAAAEALAERFRVVLPPQHSVRHQQWHVQARPLFVLEEAVRVVQWPALAAPEAIEAFHARLRRDGTGSDADAFCLQLTREPPPCIPCWRENWWEGKHVRPLLAPPTGFAGVSPPPLLTFTRRPRQAGLAAMVDMVNKALAPHEAVTPGSPQTQEEIFFPDFDPDDWTNAPEAGEDDMFSMMARLRALALV